MKTPILDHGYGMYVEHWGSDERIVEAARMSVDKGFVDWNPYWQCKTCKCYWRDNGDGTVSLLDSTQIPCHLCDNENMNSCVHHRGDAYLLRYLYTEDPKHTTPFEMAGMVVEMQAPIMVFREWHRHRTQSYNEMSARYTPLPDLNYIPSVERLLLNSKTNKQAGVIKGAEELTPEAAEVVRQNLQHMYTQQEEMYQLHLSWGVPKELARVHLPVGRYSRMRASANLLNWLKFLTLRSHHKAQWEIRQYADHVGTLVAEHFPRTWALFAEGRKP